MRVTKIQTNLYNLNVANPNLSAPAHSGGGGAYQNLKITPQFLIITVMALILISENFLTRTEPFLI